MVYSPNFSEVLLELENGEPITRISSMQKLAGICHTRTYNKDFNVINTIFAEKNLKK